jgi:hypothetical protein
MMSDFGTTFSLKSQAQPGIPILTVTTAYVKISADRDLSLPLRFQMESSHLRGENHE